MVCSEVPHSQAVYAVSAYTHLLIAVCFAAAHTRAESVEGFPQLPLRFMASVCCCVTVLGLAALLCVALQIVVPPIMLALLFEEVVTGG